jgi:hypothetical protein
MWDNENLYPIAFVSGHNFVALEKMPNKPVLYLGTTQRVPHICPVLADVGMKNLNQPSLYQGTSSLVP